MKPREPKILTSKFGKKFCIGKQNKPVGKDGVIWLTYDEWDWIKSHDLDSKQFDLLLRFKIENHHHEIITDEHRNRRRNLAVVYCENIKEMLRGRKSESTTEKKEQPSEKNGWEKRTEERDLD